MNWNALQVLGGLLVHSAPHDVPNLYRNLGRRLAQIHGESAFGRVRHEFDFHGASLAQADARYRVASGSICAAVLGHNDRVAAIGCSGIRLTRSARNGGSAIPAIDPLVGRIARISRQDIHRLQRATLSHARFDRVNGELQVNR